MKLIDLKVDLNPFVRAYAVSLTVLFALAFFDEGVSAFVTGNAEQPRLEVVMVDFKDGEFRQIVRPKYRDVQRAHWSASIRQGRHVICYGDGNHGYTAQVKPVTFSPDGWTGGDCARMIPGAVYTARATWTYLDRDGLEVSIFRSFEFVYQLPPAE